MDKFRIDKEEYSNRTFRLPNELLEELGQVAQQEDVSVNRLIVLCCRYALAHLDEEEGSGKSEENKEQ